jgi:hypothetical protein
MENVTAECQDYGLLGRDAMYTGKVKRGCETSRVVGR